MAYFNDTDEILCPHCGDEFDKTDFYHGDGDIVEIECDECGKKYTISVSASYSYTTQCGDEDTDECEYIPVKFSGEIKTAEIGGKKMIYASCVKCEETNYVDMERVKVD